tara:strand:- start:636 stop:1169 length:534 start_codon:yes stop_codon:yes gene_type:complete
MFKIDLGKLTSKPKPTQTPKPKKPSKLWVLLSTTFSGVFNIFKYMFYILLTPARIDLAIKGFKSFMEMCYVVFKETFSKYFLNSSSTNQENMKNFIDINKFNESIDKAKKNNLKKWDEHIQKQENKHMLDYAEEANNLEEPYDIKPILQILFCIIILSLIMFIVSLSYVIIKFFKQF